MLQYHKTLILYEMVILLWKPQTVITLVYMGTYAGTHVCGVHVIYSDKNRTVIARPAP